MSHLNATHTAISPAKLILSGEHAVVYGNPALAITIDRFIKVEALATSDGLFSIKFKSLPDYNVEMHHVPILAATFLNRYEDFLENKCSIREVIDQPYELVLFSAYQALAYKSSCFFSGLHLSIESSIPIGCGLGSSAAAICAVIYAVMDLQHISATPETVYPLALKAENLQHGHSSGLDIKTILKGGGMLFHPKGHEQRTLPSMPFYLVNTGRSQASTGECVSYVRPYFKDLNLLDAFARTTLAIDQALLLNHQNDLVEGIRYNHQLLTQIGVVPSKVQQFVAEIERLGGCAKICGAGSIRGDSAGVCLIMSDAPINELCSQYGYSLERVNPVNQGVHI